MANDKLDREVKKRGPLDTVAIYELRSLVDGYDQLLNLPKFIVESYEESTQ
jgi:hypothetical protein